MSLEPSPAEVASYDQVHASTTAYLGALVGTLRILVDQGIPRPLAVIALAGQLEKPDPRAGSFAQLGRADVAQLLAVAVERLEPGWPA